MREPQTWRELLGKIINDHREKQRIADFLKANPITLVRWAGNKTNPRNENLQMLVQALPQYQQQLISLITKEFPDFSIDIRHVTETPPDEIPASFYAQILSVYASNSETRRFWTISPLILQQAIEHLDPQQAGIAIIVIQCVKPSSDGKVRSLHEVIGIGTGVWQTEIQNRELFYGIESLAGRVVGASHGMIIHNRADGRELFPLSQMEYEESTAAYPILSSNRIAGCFFVASTQANFFTSRSRQALIEQYADLMALAFTEEQFYDPQQIEPGMMPPMPVQKPYFSKFQSRSLQLIREAQARQEVISNTQAELQVLQELETAFLNYYGSVKT